MSFFGHLEPYAGDPILSLNEAFQADPRKDKVNLSIGIYFDDAGRIPVLPSVREAEASRSTTRLRRSHWRRPHRASQPRRRASGLGRGDPGGRQSYGPDP